MGATSLATCHKRPSQRCQMNVLDSVRGVRWRRWSFGFSTRSVEGSDDMAKLVFGLNQSLDGYIDHQEFTPGARRFSITSSSKCAACQVVFTVAACTR